MPSPAVTGVGDGPGTAETNPDGQPPVSVIIPTRDAEATLAAAVESVLAQDYRGALEVIVADGSRTSATRSLLRSRFPGVRVVSNPEREIPAALNHALRAARHPVVMRCDARTVLPAGYVARAVETLRRTGAANVGGRSMPVGRTLFERAVALAITTPLGAGDARHRIGGPRGRPTRCTSGSSGARRSTRWPASTRRSSATRTTSSTGGSASVARRCGSIPPWW